MKIPAPSPNFQDPTIETEPAPIHTLPEGLEGFEGTPFESQMLEKLRDVPEPWNGFATYGKYPVTSSSEEWRQTNPALAVIYEGLENGSLVYTKLFTLTHADKHKPAGERLCINVREDQGFNDPNRVLIRVMPSVYGEALFTDEGQLVGYAIELSADGGRPGYVIAPPSALKITRGSWDGPEVPLQDFLPPAEKS